MHTISCFFLAEELAFFMPIIDFLPRELINIYLLEETENINNQNISLSSNFKKLSLQKYIDQGYKIHIANNKAIAETTFAITSSGIYYYFPWVDQALLERMPSLYLVHSVDGSPYAPQYSRWMIAQHHSMAIFPEKNKITYINEEFKNLCKKQPQKNTTEYAYTGPYHIGEWDKKRNLPTHQLRKEIENILKINLPNDKPIITFYKDEVSHIDSIINFLNQFAEHAIVIYKSCNIEYDPICKQIHNNVIIWPFSTMAQNILRFGSDYIMAGYMSGTFASSVMLNLKIIPYYTDLVLIKNEGRYVTYKYYLQEDSLGRKLTNSIPPINLNNINEVIKRMKNQQYWNFYQENLQTIQKNVFGDFIVNDSAKKTASLILKAYTNKTFGDNIIAIRNNH